MSDVGLRCCDVIWKCDLCALQRFFTLAREQRRWIFATQNFVIVEIYAMLSNGWCLSATSEGCSQSPGSFKTLAPHQSFVARRISCVSQLFLAAPPQLFANSFDCIARMMLAVHIQCKHPQHNKYMVNGIVPLIKYAICVHTNGKRQTACGQSGRKSPKITRDEEVGLLMFALSIHRHTYTSNPNSIAFVRLVAARVPTQQHLYKWPHLMNDSQWTQAHVFSIHFYFLFLFIDLHVGRVRVCVCVYISSNAMVLMVWMIGNLRLHCSSRCGEIFAFRKFSMKNHGFVCIPLEWAWVWKWRHWRTSWAIKTASRWNTRPVHHQHQYNDDKSSNSNRKTSPKLNLCHWQQRWDTNRWTRAWQKRLTNLCVHIRCNAMT